MTVVRPVPVFHSPKATVLLVPSVMVARVMATPPSWKTPLGGAEANAGSASNSSDEPTEAK